jgi:hypothetical protein
VAKLSRPYQIALAAVAVLALVWFVALRGHSSNPSVPAPSSPASQPAQSSGSASGSVAASEAHKAAAPTPIYHGPAPGVEGLTRDIAKAHGAVATSQAEAARVEHSSADSSEAGSSSSSSGSSSTNAHAGTHTATHASSSSSKAPSASSKSSKPASSDRPHDQLEVEHEISSGKTVLLVFWQPKSTVDQTVHQQALAVGGGSKGRVVVHVALAKQVGLFGPVTEVTHVYQTPTVLIVGRHGLVSELTGLQDAFSLRQAVREAEQANR